MSDFENVTVIESRAVQYLLMKLRRRDTMGKVNDNISVTRSVASLIALT